MYPDTWHLCVTLVFVHLLKYTSSVDLSDLSDLLPVPLYYFGAYERLICLRV
jgi:hypothetical protein